MVFSSLPFILVFMPMFFICYYSVPYKFKNIILLLGSFVFYFIGTLTAPYHFILFLISIIIDFAIGIGIEKYPKIKKPIFASGLIFHLVCLGVFKYGDFILSEISKNLQYFEFNSKIILPIGISFYTFQGISYIADVYLKKIKAEKSLLKYAVYISSFEQLIAGPIVTYSQVKNELYDRKITFKNAFGGLQIFIFGLGLKVLLANPVGKLWSQTLAIGFESVSTPLAWMAIIAYSFQIYFDFFGYSLMAIGLGKMLGFKLPQNFNHPYTSVTMTEFWRRWHITLGEWFKDYVYVPLGGIRKGTKRMIFNLFTVWFLTGIWHGAGYNFILWGLFLFSVITVEKLFIGNFLNSHKALGHIYMMILIPIMWSVFAVGDIRTLGTLFSRLFPFFGQKVLSVFKYDYIKYLKQYYPFLICGTLFSVKLPYRLLKKIQSKLLIGILLTAVFAASVYCMYKGLDDPFLYFRF